MGLLNALSNSLRSFNMSLRISESSFHMMPFMVMEMQTELMLVIQWLESWNVLSCFKCSSSFFQSSEGGYGCTIVGKKNVFPLSKFLYDM